LKFNTFSILSTPSGNPVQSFQLLTGNNGANGRLVQVLGKTRFTIFTRRRLAKRCFAKREIATALGDTQCFVIMKCAVWGWKRSRTLWFQGVSRCWCATKRDNL